MQQREEDHSFVVPNGPKGSIDARALRRCGELLKADTEISLVPDTCHSSVTTGHENESFIESIVLPASTLTIAS